MNTCVYIWMFFPSWSLWLWSSFLVPDPGLISASSCGEPGGPTWRRPGRISDTGTAGDPCASCSGGWARRNVQTSSRSPPSRSGTASPLGGKQKHKAVSTDPQVMAVQTPPPPPATKKKKRSILSCNSCAQTIRLGFVFEQGSVSSWFHRTCSTASLPPPPTAANFSRPTPPSSL